MVQKNDSTVFHRKYHAWMYFFILLKAKLVKNQKYLLSRSFITSSTNFLCYVISKSSPHLEDKFFFSQPLTAPLKAGNPMNKQITIVIRFLIKTSLDIHRHCHLLFLLISSACFLLPNQIFSSQSPSRHFLLYSLWFH